MRVTRACICGSDLWPYNSMEPTDAGQPMGHEAIGVVEDVGARGHARSSAGDLVVDAVRVLGRHLRVLPRGAARPPACTAGSSATTAWTARRREALRVPFADGTLYPLPVGEDDALMPSLLTLSDVMGTGHHARRRRRGRARARRVAVVGDGAVGLCGVIAAKRLGAEQIIILGRHADRIALAREFGATDVVCERGEEAVERVRELTGG